MNDPLSLNVQLAGVDTRMPILPETEYLFQFAKAQVVPNKDETGRNLEVTFNLAQEATSTTGKAIAPGFPIKSYYPLQASEKSKSPEFFREQLAGLIDAVFGRDPEDHANRPDLTGELVQQMLGRNVIAKVVIDNFNDRESNKISRLRAATDV